MSAVDPVVETPDIGLVVQEQDWPVHLAGQGRCQIVDDPDPRCPAPPAGLLRMQRTPDCGHTFYAEVCAGHGEAMAGEDHEYGCLVCHTPGMTSIRPVMKP